jgi:hypothetical protein
MKIRFNPPHANIPGERRSQLPQRWQQLFARPAPGGPKTDEQPLAALQARLEICGLDLKLNLVRNPFCIHFALLRRK